MSNLRNVKNILEKNIERIVRRFFSFYKQSDKYESEERFWSNLISELVQWYHGEIKERSQTPFPTNDQKIRSHTIEHSAMLTWFELHQKPKYPIDLQLPVDIFQGMKILDVGSGPMPSAEVFKSCELYCLDPLLPAYIRAGYPLHYYKDSTRFVYGYSENMPFRDDFFDAVISVNAIDHVDNISLTAKEIDRVLKPNGMIRMHVHYHKKTIEEPLELNDDVMQEAFGWCSHFRKIDEMDKKMGACAAPGESYALWSSF